MLLARWRPLLDVICHANAFIKRHFSKTNQKPSSHVLPRYHDIKRMEREQQHLEQQAFTSSACSSTSPPSDDLGSNEFRPTDGVKIPNQRSRQQEKWHQGECRWTHSTKNKPHRRPRRRPQQQAAKPSTLPNILCKSCTFQKRGENCTCQTKATQSKKRL